jgi:uncharacterized protein (TIGR03435 family)
MKTAITAIVLATIAGSAAYSQPPAGEKKDDAKLEFEVASIKPSAPPEGGRIFFGGRGGPGSGDPGRLTYNNMTLQSLIIMAYNLKSYQVSGLPDGSNSQRFDIVAKVPEGASKDDVKVMMQHLLEDRFKLTVHRETKELPIYALVVGKNGPKMKESTVPDNPPPVPPADGKGAAALPPPPIRPMMGGTMGADGCPTFPEAASGRPMNLMMMSPNGACMMTTGGTMDSLAGQLSNQFDRPVLDMTDLKGKFDYKLHYDPASMPSRSGGGMMIMGGPPMLAGGPGGPGGGDLGKSGPPEHEHEPAPSIFSALQEQLGLKLDARKAPIDMIVIDHVEKTPTEN